MPNDLPVRDKELVPRRSSKLHGELIETFNQIRQGFIGQGKRSDNILDYWDIYDCVLNNKNFYNGNSGIYVPIVYSAIDARKTRFLNQIFPQSGRYIDATSTDDGVPHAMVALLEHYIRRAKLRTEIVSSLLINGDVEGHYHLFCDWNRYERHVVSKHTRPAGTSVPDLGDLNIEIEGDDEITDLVEEVMIDEGPCPEVLHDADVLVRPVTARSIDDALQQGGDVTVIRRWTKETLENLIDAGEVMAGPAKSLLELAYGKKSEDWKNPEKAILDSAGIKEADGVKTFMIYETYKVLPTDEGSRLCCALYGGYDLILSARRIKFWNDRCPLLSSPQSKVTGSFKGSSAISKGIETLQYHANQVAQQAADSATYSMLPIIMTDPAKNPRTATMILNLAAIWEVDPNSTRFAEFPKLWQDGIALIQADTQAIFTAMGVNPAMIPGQTGKPGTKRNQAEVAMEQMVDLLTTATSCGVIEEGILTPFLEQAIDLDHQFRDQDATVKAFGEMGSIAQMEAVPPQQNRTRLNFTWFGVEQARNAQQQQQQIAWLNVARGMEPLLTKAGYMLDPVPALENSAGNVFGWRMGRQIIRDMRQQLSMDPEGENAMLGEGFSVIVHPLDDDQRHIASHMQAMQAEGDPTGEFRIHIQRHQQQMGLKAAAQMRQQMQQQQPPLGQGGGMPQQGAQPAVPRLMKGPPGMIAPEAMPRAGAVIMPRKF